MFRVVANLYAISCLVLFLLFAFMWLRGFAVADHLRYQDPKRFKGLISSRGDIAFYSYDWSQFKQNPEPGWALTSGGPIDVPAEELVKAGQHRALAGFWFFRDTKLPQAPGQLLRGWCVVVPYWFPTAFFALAPLSRILRRRPPGRRAARSATPR